MSKHVTCNRPKVFKPRACIRRRPLKFSTISHKEKQSKNWNLLYTITKQLLNFLKLFKTKEKNKKLQLTTNNVNSALPLKKQFLQKSFHLKECLQGRFLTNELRQRASAFRRLREMKVGNSFMSLMNRFIWGQISN